MRRNRGSILILAFWVLLLLSMFAITLGYNIRQKLVLYSRVGYEEQLAELASSALEMAKSTLKADVDTDLDFLLEEWASMPDAQKKISMGVGSFQMVHKGLTDENRKVNLNHASALTLSRLLELAGIAKDKAEELSYNMVDWRDEDSTLGHPQYGAEDDYYMDLDKPYHVKNGPFESLDELLIVKGMTRDIFERIKRWVAVHGSGQVNINTATLETLRALGVEKSLAEKLILFRKGADGLDSTADDRFFKTLEDVARDLENASPAFGANETAVFSALIESNQLSVSSDYFMAESIGTLNSGQQMTMEAVLNRAGKLYYSYFYNTPEKNV